MISIFHFQCKCDLQFIDLQYMKYIIDSFVIYTYSQNVNVVSAVKLDCIIDAVISKSVLDVSAMVYMIIYICLFPKQ